jgi:hypothetical protein
VIIERFHHIVSCGFETSVKRPQGENLGIFSSGV